MRKALVVGIDYYEHGSSLFGCVNDAFSVKSALDRNGDGTVNFSTEIMTATGENQVVCRGELKDKVQELFAGENEISLLFFAGHGHVESSGGYILTSEARRGDEGLSLSDILSYANESKARSRIIILDSCHSGIAGSPPDNQNLAAIKEGVTILTASTKDQYATEKSGSGIFTTLFVDSLYGGAANLVGEISIGSVYAYIDKSLGPWQQRPVFKTNVTRFVSLRSSQPSIHPNELHKLKDLFPRKGFHFELDPTFEIEMKGRDVGMPVPRPENVEIFQLLQKFNRHGLVVPVDAPHMWNAAMESKSCKLTVLGEHYRNLAENDLI